MRALTLWRPWSDAIVHGPKRVENRPWRPPDGMIGEVFAVHAGKRYGTNGWDLPEDYSPPDEDKSPTGIVGVARLIGWLERDVREGVAEKDRIHFMHAPDARADEVARLHLDPWWLGPVGWLLDDVQALTEPIPHPGALGFWRVPPEKVDRILEALDLDPLGGDDDQAPASGAPKKKGKTDG